MKLHRFLLGRLVGFNSDNVRSVRRMYVPCTNTVALPKKRARSDVFTQHAIVLFGWNEKCTVSDVACISIFICCHVTDNSPIKFFVPAEKYYCTLSKNITACACLVFGNAAVLQGTYYIRRLRVSK